jgi:GIY-YIG catalytic domain
LYYTIYKVTNKVNGKHYIGKHQTKNLDDGYMGSGKYIKHAIKKHGLENFTKEILHVFQTEDEMNAKEKELVVLSEESYNLCEGGRGGFGYINKNGLDGRKKARAITDAIIFKKYGVKYPSQIPHVRILLAQRGRESYLSGTFKRFDSTGINHTEETKKKIGLKNSRFIGELNSQYGTHWITDGSINKKIPRSDMDFWLKQGFSRGRKKR